MQWWTNVVVAFVPLWCAAVALDARGDEDEAEWPFTPRSSSSNMERRLRRLVNQPHHLRAGRQHSIDAPKMISESGDDLEQQNLVSFMTSPEDAKAAESPGGSSLRPGAGGPADVIAFGMYAKNFYGADLKTNTFRVDMVMSLRWKDDRSIKLVPDSLQRVVLSGQQASAKLWEPEMVITNHDILQYEVISTSVQVHKSGEVEKVVRAQVKVSSRFELNSYPFDTQKLKVRIASAKYMANDLVLVPMASGESNGLKDGLFDGTSYWLKSWNASVYEEADGDLVKSRGLLEIEVKRHLDKYWQDHLVPTGIVLVISWAVFYFPFATPFITPRLVLSIMALLTFTNLMIKSSSLLPGAAPFNWNDLFNQTIQRLMFVTIVINIFSEMCFHHFKLEDLGRSINHEGKVLQPCLSMLNIVMILGLGRYGMLSLWLATVLAQVLLIAILAAYAYWCVRRFFKAQAEVQKMESARLSLERDGVGLVAGTDAAADDAAADAGGDGGDGGM